MKIGIAQLSVLRGEVEFNISKHVQLINAAIQQDASAIFFPELSITGYEPTLAQGLAFSSDDSRLDVFQKLSDTHQIIIGFGLPTVGDDKPHISMIIFEPAKTRIIYSKQYLHSGEELYFVPGNGQVFIELMEYKIAPAICYESSVRAHQDHAMSHGANIYLASVLNSKTGIDKEMKGLSEVAAKKNIIVMMSNYIEETGGYDAGGKSAIWNKDGSIANQLSESDEGLLVYDLTTQECISEIVFFQN